MVRLQLVPIKTDDVKAFNHELQKGLVELDQQETLQEIRIFQRELYPCKTAMFMSMEFHWSQITTSLKHGGSRESALEIQSHLQRLKFSVNVSWQNHNGQKQDCTVSTLREA